MAPTSYDGPLHRAYAVGRALSPGTLATWVTAFARQLPRPGPLAGLDLGSGTGRFSAALADAFGPVLAVEPSEGMRAVAVREIRHPLVRHAAGSATAVPAPDASMDYCLMFLVWHHVPGPDREAAAREIARVLRPGGVLLCRTQLSDHMPDLWWLGHFPNGPQADAALYRPLAEELEVFAGAGLEPSPGLVWVHEDSLGTRAERLALLRTRTLSVLHRMPDADVEAGFASLAREVDEDPDAPVPAEEVSLLVLRKRS